MHKNSFALNQAIISFKKHQYAHERYQNLTKEGKPKSKNMAWTIKESLKNQKLVEYRKRYSEMGKNN